MKFSIIVIPSLLCLLKVSAAFPSDNSAVTPLFARDDIVRCGLSCNSRNDCGELGITPPPSSPIPFCKRNSFPSTKQEGSAYSPVLIECLTDTVITQIDCGNCCTAATDCKIIGFLNSMLNLQFLQTWEMPIFGVVLQ